MEEEFCEIRESELERVILNSLILVAAWSNKMLL